MNSHEITLWKDGEYVAKGGYFVRNDLKEFIKLLVDAGHEPVGIRIDTDSYNLEVMVKAKPEDLKD
jgi:hypothetical protein